MDAKPPPIEGAPYLARFLRQMWKTADLSTALRSVENHLASSLPRLA
jgi:hypothetical protein